MQDPKKPRNPFDDPPPAKHNETPAPNEQYELLKQRNKRRLIGAGAVTLLVGGLFAAIVGNNYANQETAEPSLTQNASSPAASDAQANSVPASSSQPPVAASGGATAVIDAPAIDSESVSQAAPPIADNVSATPIDVTETAPLAVQQSHKRQSAEQETENQRALAREKAQNRQQQALQEREAREQAIAERARQAEQARQTERERLAAQKAEQARKREQTAATTTPAPQTTKSTPAAGAGAGNFAVQAGAFRNKAQADTVRAQVAALGLNAQISTVKTEQGTLYRVQATGLSSRAAAQNAAEKMKARGLGGMIIGK